MPLPPSQQKKHPPQKKHNSERNWSPPEGKFKSSCGCALVSHPITEAQQWRVGIGDWEWKVVGAPNIKHQDTENILCTIKETGHEVWKKKNMELFSKTKELLKVVIFVPLSSHIWKTHGRTLGLVRPWPSVAEVGDLESVRVTLGVTCWLVWGKSR